MAADAIAGNTHVNVEGYRDYRGVPAVGAWTWLPAANIGVATEVDIAEAFRPLTILQWTFWGLYAVGAVGYFLLTGRPVFEARSIRDLLRQHVDTNPPPPSQVLGKPINARLEAALLACLEKSRAKRPQTARALAQLIERAGDPDGWSMEDAEAWWGRHERRPEDPGSGSSPIGVYDATMAIQGPETKE